jgi:hypothetical protein
MSHRALAYCSIGLNSLDSVRIKGNKLGEDRNQKTVYFPWRMVSFGESGQSDLGSDREDVRKCLEQCVIGLEGLGCTWQRLDCGYRLCLETIQKAVHFFTLSFSHNLLSPEFESKSHNIKIFEYKWSRERPESIKESNQS